MKRKGKEEKGEGRREGKRRKGEGREEGERGRGKGKKRREGRSPPLAGTKLSQPSSTFLRVLPCRCHISPVSRKVGRTGDNSPSANYPALPCGGADLPLPKGALGRASSLPPTLPAVVRPTYIFLIKGRDILPIPLSLSSSLHVPNWNTWPPRWPPLKIGALPE